MEAQISLQFNYDFSITESDDFVDCFLRCSSLKQCDVMTQTSYKLCLYTTNLFSQITLLQCFSIFNQDQVFLIRVLWVPKHNTKKHESFFSCYIRILYCKSISTKVYKCNSRIRVGLIFLAHNCFGCALVWVWSSDDWIIVWNLYSKPPSKCPLYTHPGSETQACGVNYHTETVLLIIDWRNARHLLMNMETLHCASPNGFSELMVVWEKWAGEVM